MPLFAVLALAAGTLALRLAGPTFRTRFEFPPRLERLFAVAATVLLLALAATAALTQGPEFAGWARPAGVAVAGVLALRRAPFPLVVLAAAGTTAALRACGIA
ncbi:AzlD domain-containing protein [Kitasatospora terrestris]|uniref:Branched-chain amino acid transporter n=1 Tax=Kitasatospora terrestris TaxID=258051 RepID=A0ABP9EEJ3_9ACTN